MQRSLDMRSREFIYGNYRYDYELLRQNRKTLSITVRPDMGIVVKCPEYIKDERINIFLKRKWGWLNKQLRYFEKLKRKIYHKEYVSGESFRYLGRQYQLIVERSKDARVSLLKGKLMVFTDNYVSDGKYNKKLLEEWYKKRVRVVFEERLDEVFIKFNYSKKPGLVIRKMNKRWGSYLADKKIILNPQLIHVPKECIDYVIAHELCHVKYKKHDKRFFDLLKSKVPDWEKKKERLESSLI